MLREFSQVMVSMLKSIYSLLGHNINKKNARELIALKGKLTDLKLIEKNAYVHLETTKYMPHTYIYIYMYMYICIRPTTTGNASGDVTHPLSAVQAVYGSGSCVNIQLTNIPKLSTILDICCRLVEYSLKIMWNL